VLAIEIIPEVLFWGLCAGRAKISDQSLVGGKIEIISVALRNGFPFWSDLLYAK
jgi:hypothetical protein